MKRASTSIMACMMFVFMVALCAAWVRGLNINCGCFGSETENSNYWLVLLRDVVLLSLSITLSIFSNAKLSFKPTASNVACPLSKPTLHPN
ncbi:hypothetical protein JIN80_07110 [Cerasicoccus arenae]|nr:hypothetical protein [Cerasicoccus arenae]